jgi:hypothetical protein
MDHVNIEAYLAEEEKYGGFWPLINVFVDPRPQVLVRIRKLHDAGYRYQPYKPEAK